MSMTRHVEAGDMQNLARGFEEMELKEQGVQREGGDVDVKIAPELKAWKGKDVAEMTLLGNDDILDSEAWEGH